MINITAIDTSVLDFISHVKRSCDTEELIYALQKSLLINTNLSDNIKILQNVLVNMVNISRL